MCLAVPSKIIKIEGVKATVQSENHTHEADVSLLDGAQVGDYVLVHGDLAINKVPGEEAGQILKMINKINNHEHE
jgi:hydrogenase expression/formation protein HypC